MTIRVQCTCGQIYELGDEWAGQQAKCQTCNMVFQVPGAPTQAQIPSPQNPSAAPQQNPAAFPQQNPAGYQPPTQHPNPNAGFQQSVPMHGDPLNPSGSVPQDPFAGLDQPMQQPMGYQPNQPGYPGHPNSQGKSKPMDPKKLAWIIGGSIGGVLVLVVLIAILFPGKESRRRAVQQRPKGGTLEISMTNRLITSGIATLVGVCLLVVGIEEFRTKKAEEMGRARFTNMLLGRSNTYTGRTAEWAAVGKMFAALVAFVIAISAMFYE